MGRNSSASVRCGAGRGLARPDPPNSTGTRCDALAAGVADMGFSFGKKGNAQPWRGLVSPFGYASLMRSGSAPVSRTGMG